MFSSVVQVKYDKLGSMMDERLKRHWAACEALALGYGLRRPAGNAAVDAGDY